jgi:radical SAM protein with 4Fe4S-binding SPASM domain
MLNTLVFPKTKRRLVIRKDNINYFPDNKMIKSGLSAKNFQLHILTIFQGTNCNLDCKYCYAEDKNHDKYINLDFVQEVADFIGKNCKKNKLPFILGFRGSNEPLLKLELIKSCFEIGQDVAKKYKLKFHTHAITNGVIHEQTAIWAANHINEILLSWDGPEQIQNENRIFPDGTGSFKYVEKTAKIFLESKLTNLQVRATITKASENKLLEIARFFKDFGVNNIDFNPLYQNEDISVDNEYFPDKIMFVKNYLKVKKWAANNNMNVEFAGSRVNSVHDKQCTIFQNNLAITPDNYFTSCFQATHNNHNKNDKYMFGGITNKNTIDINWQKINQLYQDLSLTYRQCANCFNILHCNKSCPNICPLRNNYTQFDCTIEKWIGLSDILLQAGYKFTDEDLDNCSSFFSNINIKQLTV